MIGDFLTAPIGSIDAIFVVLVWSDGEPHARLNVSGEVRQALALKSYPEVDIEPMRLASALSYAVFLAMAAQLPLRIAGDLSVWSPVWGSLLGDPASTHTSETVARAH